MLKIDSLPSFSVRISSAIFALYRVFATPAETAAFAKACVGFAPRILSFPVPPCPVPKVTRKGGGAALPWKRDLLAAILRETVRASEWAVRAARRERAM